MDYKQIEAFVNVVRYKSFSKAADASFFTQPTISTHIQNLEKELGVKLLDRKSRSVEMTPQGTKFYKYAVEMINARAQAIEAINSSAESVEGILEIQASSVPGVTFLPELMSDFRKLHEGIQYYVSISDSQVVVDNIIERIGEIGFIGEQPKHASLESCLVAKDRSVLIAPKSYDISKEISLKDITDFPFIWRETGSATRKNFEHAAAGLGFDQNQIKLAALVDDLDSIIRSVESGLGVSIVSEKVAASLGDRVKIAEFSDFSEDRSFYMINLKSTSLSPAAKAFADYVKESSKSVK